ncbi:unnamed protein product [Rotaria sp. Silwood2]|nr:unnamed protein product [Rotaria sp. Silwood2]
MNRFGDIDASFKKLPPIYGYRSEKLVPIEKALEPIEPQINELPYYIKIAKRYCHFPSEHGLTHDESAAVYIYTMEWGETTLYRILNKALRSENRQALKIWFPYLKLFDTALDKLPTVKEVVWRGVPLDIGKNFAKDQIVTWWSVNSCSSSVDVIKNFLGSSKHSTLFLIEAIYGKKISRYTEYENEDEIILRMGSQFRVKSNPLDYSYSSHVVHFIEIDDNNDQSLTSAMNEMHSPAKPSYINTSVIPNIPVDVQWTQNGVTVAGGHGHGDSTAQLQDPHGLAIDDDQTIVVADSWNHRVVQWKMGDTNGQVVAGGHGQGNRLDQLNCPTDVLIDKETDSLIVCDWGNRRVVRWSRRSGTTQGEILVDNVMCAALAMDDQRHLYISDTDKHEVRQYQIGDRNGTVVAGGHGEGAGLNQMNFPTYLFADQQQTIYMSDNNNHRVMKWDRGAKEGFVVAGGYGEGEALTQLYSPHGLFVDTLGTTYVADTGNHRVMCWSKEAKHGIIIVGGNGYGQGANQLSNPKGLSFDRHNNLYVVDCANHRVQRFSIK